MQKILMGLAGLLLFMAAPAANAQTYNLSQGAVTVDSIDFGQNTATTDITDQGSGVTTVQSWAWDNQQQLYVNGQGNTMLVDWIHMIVLISQGHPNAGSYDMW